MGEVPASSRAEGVSQREENHAGSCCSGLPTARETDEARNLRVETPPPAAQTRPPPPRGIRAGEENQDPIAPPPFLVMAITEGRGGMLSLKSGQRVDGLS